MFDQLCTAIISIVPILENSNYVQDDYIFNIIHQLSQKVGKITFFGRKIIFKNIIALLEIIIIYYYLLLNESPCSDQYYNNMMYLYNRQTINK